jgi:serine/threonine protein kinase
VRTCCAVVCQVLEALGHAHGLGLVHRDVKPSNILVTRQGRKLAVKLADFGLAKNYHLAGLSGLTSEGEARGTFAFMPPEQLADSRSARPAADLYAAGATLYFYLTSAYPYVFSNVAQLQDAFWTQEPVRLESRCPGLPPGLADVVHQSLARDPTERFPSAHAMRKALLPYARRSE